MNIRGKSGSTLTAESAYYALEGPREQVIAGLQTIIEDCQDALLRLPLRSLCAQMESGLRHLEAEAAEYLSDLVNDAEDEAEAAE